MARWLLLGVDSARLASDDAGSPPVRWLRGAHGYLVDDLAARPVGVVEHVHLVAGRPRLLGLVRGGRRFVVSTDDVVRVAPQQRRIVVRSEVLPDDEAHGKRRSAATPPWHPIRALLGARRLAARAISGPGDRAERQRWNTSR